MDESFQARGHELISELPDTINNPITSNSVSSQLLPNQLPNPLFNPITANPLFSLLLNFSSPSTFSGLCLSESKLATLVENSFQTNQLLFQIINLLQTALLKTGTIATSPFSTTGTNLNDQAIANLPSSVTKEYEPAIVEPEQVNEEATDASNTTPTTKDHLSNSTLMHMASKSKTKRNFCCSVLKTLFSASELVGKSVYGSRSKQLLDRQRVEKIKQSAIVVYGETEITDKVWALCVSSMKHLVFFYFFKRNFKRTFFSLYIFIVNL